MLIDHTEKEPVNNTHYSDFVYKVYTRNPAAFVHHIEGIEVEEIKHLSNGDMLNIIISRSMKMSEHEKQAFIEWYC